MNAISRIGLFVSVVKHQGFASAARQLGMTGPALSKQVKALEEQLGVRLLNRTTRNITLTEEGAIYFARAEQALDDLAEAEQEIHELKACPIGRLKINIPASFGRQYLAEPISKFALKHKDIIMDVDTDDRLVDVIAEGYDAVIRIGTLADSSLIAKKLASCPIIPCASPEYIKKHGQPRHPKELANHRAILYTKHGDDSSWQFIGPGKETGTVNRGQNFAANSGEILLSACNAGLGIAILPMFIASPALASGQLIQLLPEYQSYPERSIYIVYPDKKFISTKLRLFIDHISACCRELAWERT